MPRADAAVTGLGLVTPAGTGVERNWETVCAPKPAAALDPALTASPVRISCRVPDFDPAAQLGARRAHHLDRFVQLGLVAAREALADAGLDPAAWDGTRVGVVLGCGDGGTTTLEREHRVLLEEGARWVSPLLIPMHPLSMLAGQVAMEFGALGPNLVVATACASGTSAVGAAKDLLALDRCDIVLTGAGESTLTPLIISGFAQMKALSRRHHDPAGASRPFDADRDGFVAGEGAGVLVLERPDHARARGARVRARVVGYGASADAHHMTAPHPEGRGIEAALRAALEDAGASPADVAHVNAHGTSTPLNDLAEAKALRRVLPGSPLVTSTKGVTGHLLGAAGAAEAVYTVLAVERGLVPPTANLERLDRGVELDIPTVPARRRIGLALTESLGFGGQNAVLAVAGA
ncbi:beta-ketoacyl-[acyl-carrier-protein] synthase family protein [Streptomyces boncukensis]|uniref:Beta-ketoacyl-[acyl-carrier-protein] synthase family protein n=1 Tax=Streptomyces boncukensis TaxID=2711219 RepID=A0A6G4WQF2_9ACTN|nr:beta-ketoacyl-[acyl-carrier-protein] synthase family protein [Streptomyces boncukensis]NGO66857.1 beta-ketoacyl-[acyl-carrier-protein] synthase family protein [Streptomyces boncukensis]